MRKRELLWGGLLIITMTFSAAAFTACHKDDKKNEEVMDPLSKEKEYYIVGTVTDTQGPLPNVKVDAGNNLAATTDANGLYLLTVKETGKYTLKFTVTGMENYEHEITLAETAENHAQITLNVKMVRAISFEGVPEETVQGGKETTVEVAPTPSGGEEPLVKTTVNLPQGGAEEGTKIAAVAYEEPKASGAEETPSGTPGKETATLSAVALKVTPDNAVAKTPIEIKTTASQGTGADVYFDPTAMEALRDKVVTKTATHFGQVTFKDGYYIITIPQGEAIGGKYLTNLLPQKTVNGVQQGGYNRVNEQEGVIKIENRDYSALHATLKVATTCGWEYTTTPEAALKAAGAPEWMATILKKCIRDSEGGKDGAYTVNKELKTAISGNHQLVFGSRIKIQDKSYTFPVFVHGTKKSVAVKLRSYVGYTEEYSNTPIAVHSGGTTGK